MLVTPLGIFMDVRLEQFWNAISPILVRPSGKDIEVRLEQSRKVQAPILVTPSGILTVLKLEHPSKVKSLMAEKPLGIVKFVNSTPFKNNLERLCSGLEYSSSNLIESHDSMDLIYTDSIFSQEENASEPILVKLSGMLMDVRAEQREKALFSIVVTPSGSFIDIRAEHS